MLINHIKYSNRPMLVRTLPFAIFIGLILIEELGIYLFALKGVAQGYEFKLYLYPLKVLCTAITLYYFRNCFTEIKGADLRRGRLFFSSAFIGGLVFILWINMDWTWATTGKVTGYDPTLENDAITRYFLIVCRVIGASIVVPIMEELFWRSWMLRFLIAHNFTCVPIGSFTWRSFSIGCILFGLEHNLWFAGIMAGALYSLLLYRTGSIASCIFAHAVTNSLLSGYVLLTSNWKYW